MKISNGYIFSAFTLRISQPQDMLESKRKMRVLKIVSFFSLLVIISCGGKENVKHTIFRLGYKSDSFSTGPLMNSGFVFKLNDATPLIFLTAHHVVAGYDGGDQYYEWFEIKDKVKSAWLWSMHDSTYQLKLGKNIPIPHAKTLVFDLAAFHIAPQIDIGYLESSLIPAKVGDTVQLFSKLNYADTSKLITPAKVIYTTDSILVYELLTTELIRMSGTSGSPILNINNKLIASSYGGLTIPNQEVKDGMAMDFPLINKLKIEEGKSYGIAIPVSLVRKSLLNAISATKSNNK